MAIFSEMPADITCNIFSRLSVREMCRSKSVARYWRTLLESEEFLAIYLGLSSSNMVCADRLDDGGVQLILYELVDGQVNVHANHYIAVNNGIIPRFRTIEGCSRGLVLLRYIDVDVEDLCIWNPIGFHYYLTPGVPAQSGNQVNLYGFGSTAQGVYKVIRISYTFHPLFSTLNRDTSMQCLTVGSHEWRNIICSNEYEYIYQDFGALSNGCLHWIVKSNVSNATSVSCFDVEHEHLTIFSMPDIPNVGMDVLFGGLCSFESQLSLCDNTSIHEIGVWVMTDYASKLWTRMFVIRKEPEQPIYTRVHIVKHFTDGSILFSGNGERLFYYSSVTDTNETIVGPPQASGLGVSIALYKPYSPSVLVQLVGENHVVPV